MVHDNKAVPFNHILSLSIEEGRREISGLMFGSPMDFTNFLREIYFDRKFMYEEIAHRRSDNKSAHLTDEHYRSTQLTFS